MRNRLFRENQAKDCQEIEELRRICCEETDRARPVRIDDLSLHQERNPTTVSQLLTQIQDWQNKANSLSDAREFYDPETASSSGASHVPSRPSAIPSPRTMPCRDSGLPHDTRKTTGTSRNVCERLPAREGQTKTLFNNSKNLATSSLELRHSRKYQATGEWNETRTAEFVNTCTTLPKWRWNHLSYWWNLFSRWNDWLSEILVFGRENFLTLWNFKAGKSTSKLKYVQNQQILISQCNGPKKFEIAKSIDELMTSRSITGRRDFSGYDSLMRWLRLHWKDFSTSMFAFVKEYVSKSSVLKSTTDSCEGDKIAYMIYEHFRATGAYDVVQGL